MINLDPIVLAFTLGLVALVPLIVVTTTSFLKISIVLSLVRNALGVQQAPPNIALYSLALMLTVFIMTPVGYDMAESFESQPTPTANLPALLNAAKAGAEPMRKFLLANSKPEQREFFLSQAKRMWPPKVADAARHDDLVILVPGFVVTELTAAFEIGFLLFLPFIVIDLVISNILMAMGMMMVSPVTISLPLKLFLFVMVDGWSRLLHGLVMTYRF
ncbi:Flagellar biosynthetic protein FliP precursor [Variovorax sp. PBL-H6]|uniref:type III secretion system export apparatus subunit SctR n=1 Tax=Variovorax sp. PBL-H6 TaxID=434009 RepID=UPI001317F459|nr:type III secretion system export apparatus subunit SctR [Variovorax sp. PBL-H6]VTU22812.1 Flagellar biosynthetic protein FliP precursor [Variovorax sp. PBL-H6]